MRTTARAPLGSFFLVSALAAAAGAGCASNPPSGADAKYPPREEGCEVAVYPETPPGPTENIGPVRATCDESVSNADCTRTLKDQACKLGADVIWGVGDPVLELGKKKLSGRAAHTKSAPK